MPTTLFIYGTLHPDRAPAEIAVAARRLIPIGQATIRARLYNLGAYPGAILDAQAPPLAGELFTGAGRRNPRPSRRVRRLPPSRSRQQPLPREKTVVTLDDGTHQTCWVYVYNGCLP